MAAPDYRTDLTDIDLAESTTGWATVNFSGGGGAALDFGPDLAMEGTNSVLRQVSAHDRGGVFDNGTTIPGASGDNVHVFQWLFIANPGLTDTIQNTGVCVIIGSSTANLVRFHVEGNDTYGAQGRVGKCYPIRYRTDASTVYPYRTLTGSPGNLPQVFGGSCNISVSTKGLNLGLDANRYGTGAYLMDGTASNPLTFSGFSAVNDTVTNRWGILTGVGGSNYELQGRFVIGSDPGGGASGAYFADSDINITFVDTPHTLPDFSQIIITAPNAAGATAYFTNMNLTAGGTSNPGQFNVDSINPTVFITGGTWTDIGDITFQSNTTVSGLTCRGTKQIVQNGASLDSMLIDSIGASAAILSDDPGSISNCEFVGDFNHAIEINTTGTYTFIGNTYSGYAAGTGGNVGNEAIYNNSGGLVILNISGGGESPSYRNSSGSITEVNNNIAVTLTGLPDNTEVRVFTAGGTGTDELAGVENATDGSPGDRSFTFSLGQGTVVDYRVVNVLYEIEEVYGYTIPSTDTTLPVQLRFDRNYI